MILHYAVYIWEVFEWLKIAIGALFYEILNKTCNINSELKAILAIFVAKFKIILKKKKIFCKNIATNVTYMYWHVSGLQSYKILAP